MLKSILISGVVAFMIIGCDSAMNDYEVKEASSNQKMEVQNLVNGTALTTGRLKDMLQKRNEFVFMENGLETMLDVWFDKYVSQFPNDEKFIKDTINQQSLNFQTFKSEYKNFESKKLEMTLLELSKLRTQLNFMGSQYPMVASWIEKVTAEIKERNNPANKK